MRGLTAILVAGFGLCTAVPSLGADALKVQLKWMPQAQFAGYYVAQEREYYADVELDVTLVPGGPGITPSKVLAAGDADVAVDWMTPALVARAEGTPVVNIAQAFTKSALAVVCRRDSGVSEPEDLRGKRIAVWPEGDGEPFEVWMSKLGIPIGGANGVTLVAEGVDPVPLLKGGADCVSALMYDEYWRIVEAGYAPEALVVVRFQNEGVGLLEDGLYAREDQLKDPKSVDLLARFVWGSIQGWRWAAANQDAAVDITMAYIPPGESTREHQAHVLAGVLKILDRGVWELDVDDYEHTVDILMMGSKPVLNTAPRGAWTDDVTDRVGLR